MFGKLFNTLQQTINMEGPAAPGASASSGPSFSGASLPSLADFGLGSLTGSAPQPPRPRAPGPGPGPPGGPRPPMAQRPPGPGGPPPDVDLTGLSEEEKAMIQSVMMRAQESEAAKAPQVTPQTMGAPRQPMPMQQGQVRPPVSQFAQQQQQQQRPPTSQYQQQPPTSMSQASRPQQPQQQPGMMQQRPPQPQQQQQQQYPPQMQQPQQITRPPQQVMPGQPISQQQPTSLPSSLGQQQQQRPQFSQSSQPVNQNQYNVSTAGGVGMPPQAVSQPQVSMYQQPSTSLATGYQPPMNQEQQMMDRQNFIESLQRQAQPDSVIQPPLSSASLTGSAPFSGPQQGLYQQPAPTVSSASSMNLGQNVITSMYQGQPPQVSQQPPSSGYSSTMTSSSTLASNSSFQTSSSFNSSSVNQASFVPSSTVLNSMQQPLPNNSYQVNNKGLDERLMQAGGPTKMVHQQSWSEGTFESVLPSVDMSIYNQSGRRKSLEAMTALTEMGMSRVIEPFEIKLPKMTLSPEESESSSQVSGSEGRMEMDKNESLTGTGSSRTAPSSMNITITSAAEVVQSPSREYKSVSQLANVSSCPVTSSTLSGCVNEPVLNVVLPPPQPPLPIPQPEPIPIQIPPEPELSLKPYIPVQNVQPSQLQTQLPVTTSHVGMAIAPSPPLPTSIPDTKDIPVSQYSVRTKLTPVTGLSSFEEPPKVSETVDIPVSQYYVRTRLTPVSGLRSLEEPTTIPSEPSPPSKPESQTTASYEFKTVQSTKSDVSSFQKQSLDRTQIPDPNPLRKKSSEQISPPKSAVSSRKSSEIDFSTASITSPDTEALMKTLSKYDPTKAIEPIIIPDLNLDSLLKSPPSFPKASTPKSSPPKLAISSDHSIAHKTFPHEKVMTMNPFSVILKSFEHDSPPGDENPSLVTHSSQTTPSCDFVEDQFPNLTGSRQDKQQKQVKQKQHVTTQTTKSMIVAPSPPSSLPKTTRSPSPGSRTCSDRKLIKTNAIMTATTATSPLNVQQEESNSTRTSTQSSQFFRDGGGRGGGYDFMSVRKLAETERRASFGGTAQSMSQQTAGAEFTGRTGAQLPAIPSDTSGTKVMNEKGFVWNRSGSLSEQAFIEQINEMRGLPSVPATSASGIGVRNDQTRMADEQLNFEIDEDYEREGEEYFVEDDEDDIDVRRQQGLSEAGDVYTIPEESEEESPKVETKSQEEGEVRKAEEGSKEGLPRENAQMLQQQNMQHIRVTSKIAPSQVQPAQNQYQAQQPVPSQVQQQNNLIRQQQQQQFQQQQQQFQQQQQQSQMLQQQNAQMLQQQQMRGQPAISQASMPGQVSSGQMQPQQPVMISQSGPYTSIPSSQVMSMGQFIQTQTSMGVCQQQPITSMVPAQPQSIRGELGMGQAPQEQPQRSQQFPVSQPQQMHPQTSQPQQMHPQTSQPYQGQQQFPTSQPGNQPQPSYQQSNQQQPQMGHQHPQASQPQSHPTSQHRRNEQSNKHPNQQQQYFQHPQFPHHSQNQQLLPQSSKKMATLPQDYWVESDLSPIQDVSPTIEAAEQRSMEMMKRNHPGHGHEVQSNQVSGSGQGGLPRATSGTISGMIADFNKQMEALSVTSPTEDLYTSPQQRSSTGQLSSARSSVQSKRGDQNKYNASSSSLRLTPSAGGIEKTVSPVIEQTLHQQQLLLHQQQQLIELQRDQQQIQKALQDQLKLQTLQTQMQLEQQNKTQTTAPAAKKEVITIGTSMSMPGTPKSEGYDPKSDFRDRKQNDARSSRRRASPDDRYSRDSFESPERRVPMEDGRGPVRRDDRRSDERRPIRRDERRNDCRDINRRDDRRDDSREDRRDNRRDDRRSYEEPVSRRRPASPDYNEYGRDLSPEILHRSDRRHEYSSRSGANSKKDRRRLPQPTVEEMKGAVEAITGSSVLSRSGQVARSSSPVLLNKAQLSSVRSLINERMVNLQPPQQTIIPGSAPSILGAGSTGLLGSSSLIDHRAVSPGLLITSYPLQVVSPLTAGLRSHSPIGETVSDSASEAWKKNRKLPLQPSEEPVTPASIVKKLLLEDRFKTSSASNLYSSSIPPLRAASSLDSATHPLLSSSLTAARSTTGLGGRISPYTGLTDVTNLINTSLGRSTPPLVTTLRAGKNTSGSILDQLRSSSRGVTLSPSRSGSPRLTPSGYYKNMKEQLKDELKSAVEERRMLLEMNEREMTDLCPPSSDTDLRALFDLYSDVPDVLLPSAALSARNRRLRNLDSEFGSPLPSVQDLPSSSYYKSAHEFNAMDPMSFGSEYRRPLSSMTGTDNIRVEGLSSLGNEEQLFTDPYQFRHKYRRRSDGSLDLDNLSYALDAYGRPVLCDSDPNERRRKSKLKATAKMRNFMSFDDDQLTREEKAARIRAEIARRREQLINSETHLLPPSSNLDPGQDHFLSRGSPSSYYDDDPSMMGHHSRSPYYPEDEEAYIDYEQDLMYDSRFLDPRVARLQNAAYLSRSLDTAFEEFDAYEQEMYERERLMKLGLLSRRGMESGRRTAGLEYDYEDYEPGMDNYGVDPYETSMAPTMPLMSGRRVGKQYINDPRQAQGRRLNNPGVHFGNDPRTAGKTYPRYPFPVKRILLTRDPKEPVESGSAFGMRVIGGKPIPNTSGMIGAFVAKILPGGVVDTLGEVREGNQVMEWNSVPLTGKTHDEVQAIIRSSLNLDEVEIIIRADINMPAEQLMNDSMMNQFQYDQQQQQQQVDQMNRQQQQQQQLALLQQQQQQQQSGHNIPQVMIDPAEGNMIMDQTGTSIIDHGGNPIYGADDYDEYQDMDEENERRLKMLNYNEKRISGEIQLQICYDTNAAILYVTVLRAKDLRTVRDSSPDPFVKCYLLPPRILEHQRRTRYFSRTCDPEWKQTMVYPEIRRQDLAKKFLEISVWSFNIYEAHEFLGQVIIHLSENFMMDDDPVWYPLGGTENVFRLNSELPHKRTPQSGILRSAYRAELEAPIDWSQNQNSPASQGFPRSPNSNTPSAQGSARKFKFNLSEKLLRAMDGGKVSGNSIFKPRPAVTRSNLIFAFGGDGGKRTSEL